MLRHTITTLGAIAVMSAIAIGQSTPAEVPAPQKPAEATAPAPPRTPAQLVNVRIELTITEQREGATIPPLTVTMLIVDRESGRVRAGAGNALLNVDARPELTRDGRIRLFLSLEYRRQADDAEKGPTAMLTESLASILEDGKSVVVSQSADPTSARIGVRVEVKATIAK